MVIVSEQCHFLSRPFILSDTVSIIAGSHRELFIVCLTSLEVTHQFKPEGGPINCVCIVSDSIIFGGIDGTISIYNILKQDFYYLKGHGGAINCIERLPNNRECIITASDDSVAIIWHLPTQKRICTIGGAKDLLMTIAFSPCGNMLVTGGTDTDIRIYDISSTTLKYNSKCVEKTSYIFEPIFTSSEICVTYIKYIEYCGHFIAVVGYDNTIRFFKPILSTKREVLFICKFFLDDQAKNPIKIQILDNRALVGRGKQVVVFCIYTQSVLETYRIQCTIKDMRLVKSIKTLIVLGDGGLIEKIQINNS